MVFELEIERSGCEIYKPGYGGLLEIFGCDGDIHNTRNLANRFAGADSLTERSLVRLVDDVFRGLFGIAQFFCLWRFAYKRNNKFTYGL